MSKKKRIKITLTDKGLGIEKTRAITPEDTLKMASGLITMVVDNASMPLADAMAEVHAKCMMQERIGGQVGLTKEQHDPNMSMTDAIAQAAKGQLRGQTGSPTDRLNKAIHEIIEKLDIPNPKMAKKSKKK